MKTCDIRVGTCGFSYRDWRDVFYPPDLKTTDFLAFYAEHFNFVEIDSTYYRRPEAPASRKICDKVPGGFLFSVKTTGSLTHERGDDWKTEADLFIRGIEPYRDEGKLGAVLAQFPYSFHYTEENRRYLARLCDFMKDLPLCLEFRNDEWCKPAVYQGLAARGVGMVQPDLPALKGLPVSDGTVTGTTGYVRFHGRNSASWWNGNATSRYDYLYSEDELSRRLEMLLDMTLHAARLFIAFNNHHKGQAVKNAISLERFLEEKNIGSD